jgi:Cu+-exporting ATPase
MSSTTRDTPSAATGEIELAIGGMMTCASWAARVERKLNKLDGVTATVNFTTEKAKVLYPAGLAPDELVKTVAAAGYTAHLPERRAATATEPDASGDEQDDSLRALRQRLLVTVALAVPVILLAMVPPLQFTNWQWVSLTLAAPVVIWGAWPSTTRPGPTCGTARPPWTP